jgi:hypothetical protein
MSPAYPRKIAARLVGSESFHEAGGQLEPTVLEFWRWAYSDLLSNATRGVLAEFIVSLALGCTGAVRDPWDASDLVTPEGTKVEVKTSAYLQSWAHSQLSRVCFSIRPSRAWSADTNVFSSVAKRQADVYVFCLLHHQSKDTVDPINLSQWTFYVVPASRLNQRLATQKTLSLRGLQALEAVPATFGSLKEKVAAAHTANST